MANYLDEVWVGVMFKTQNIPIVNLFSGTVDDFPLLDTNKSEKKIEDESSRPWKTFSLD